MAPSYSNYQHTTNIEHCAHKRSVSHDTMLHNHLLKYCSVTNSAPFCICSTFLCTELGQRKHFFQTLSEVAIPFLVGGKGCFCFYFSIQFLQEMPTLFFVGGKDCFFLIGVFNFCKKWQLPLL